MEEKHERTFLTDWVRKLFALAFALISFFIINRHIAQEYTIENVKVDFKLADSGKLTLLNDDITAKVTVKTTLPISSLKSNMYTVVISIPDIKSDERKFRYRIDAVPDNVRKGFFLPEVQTVTLSRDYVELDPIIRKSVPIEVSEVGMTKPGFTAYKTLSPETVTVIGPSEKLKNVKFISSEDLAMTPETSDFTCHLQLKKPMEDISFDNSKADSDSVEVTVKIVNDKELVTEVYADVPIRLFTTYPNLYNADKMEKKVGRIEVHALRSILDAYCKNTPYLYVDLTEAEGPGLFQAQVHAGNVPPSDKAKITYEPSVIDMVLSEQTKAPAIDDKAPAAAEEGAEGK